MKHFRIPSIHKAQIFEKTGNKLRPKSASIAGILNKELEGIVKSHRLPRRQSHHRISSIATAGS